MKEKEEHYKGIEFIRISKLPAEQRDTLTKSISPDKIIKILMDKELVIDCVQYKHYAAWYDTHHTVKAESNLISVEKTDKSTVTAVKVAINN